jgi:hypothetical protein
MKKLMARRRRRARKYYIHSKLLLIHVCLAFVFLWLCSLFLLSLPESCDFVCIVENLYINAVSRTN